MMTLIISKKTLLKVAEAIREAVARSVDDEDLAEAALKAFADNATLNDWDSMDSEKP